MAGKALSEQTAEVLLRAVTWVTGDQATELKALYDAHAKEAGLKSFDSLVDEEAKAEVERAEKAEAERQQAAKEALARDAETDRQAEQERKDLEAAQKEAVKAAEKAAKEASKAS